MTTSRSKAPFTWRDYEHGRSSPRQGSTGSFSSRVHFDEPSPAAESSQVDIPHGGGESHGLSGRGLRHRRYHIKNSDQQTVPATDMRSGRPSQCESILWLKSVG